MDVILDANVLFRTLISSGDIIDVMFHQSLQLYAPDLLRIEFLNHQHEIIKKSHLSKENLTFLTDEIFKEITFIKREFYSNHIKKASQILNNHTKDTDFIALCIAKKCKLWTYEKRLFDIGYGISTKEINTALQH